jgi:hypothetical protein
MMETSKVSEKFNLCSVLGALEVLSSLVVVQGVWFLTVKQVLQLKLLGSVLTAFYIGFRLREQKRVK